MKNRIKLIKKLRGIINCKITSSTAYPRRVAHKNNVKTPVKVTKIGYKPNKRVQYM